MAGGEVDDEPSLLGHLLRLGRRFDGFDGRRQRVTLVARGGHDEAPADERQPCGNRETGDEQAAVDVEPTSADGGSHGPIMA
ncbi:MAG: hypothetical protein WKF58_03955 [Ilumatobacteraceae bacterium]